MNKVKIGLIIDNYHLKYKVSEFLKYLKNKAKISLYVQESFILKNSEIDFNEDLFFIKGKGKVIIALARLIENETSIPLINSPKAIWLTIHRFLNSLILRKAGVLVPDFALIPCDYPPPFDNYIIKNIIDQKTYAFNAKIQKVDGCLKVSDQRALDEIDGKENYQYLYYQKFIKSKWEYKVYSFGDNLFYYKQLPILVNPNKMETRKKINEIPELKANALKAMKILNLKVVSIDFLKSKDGKYYLTDINSLPNFNYIENGPKLLADFLINQAKI
ncbi:MAG: RimK family alpha-L-glutamate ligase [Promethearchaeota archaeon]